MSDQDFRAGLHAIRRKRAQMWVVFVGYLPVVFLAMHAGRALGLDEKIVVVPTALAWMALFAFTIVRAGWARCPRCGRRFSQRIFRGLFVSWSNPFNRRCLNCKLPLN